MLTFIRPMEATIIIDFNIVKLGCIVDQIITGRGLYIQAGRPGARIAEDPLRPKVLLEVTDTGFSKIWDEIFPKHMTKHFRNKGLSRTDAKRAATAAIEEWRKLSKFRMRDNAAD